MRYRSSPLGNHPRSPFPISARQPSAWASLAGCLILATAVGAEAGVPQAPDRAVVPMGSKHRLMTESADPIVGQRPRLVLVSGRGVAPVLLSVGAEASHPNPFTLVGNRTGLANATRLQIRDGEAWLTTPPTRPHPTGLAAFQDQGSSIASR